MKLSAWTMVAVFGLAAAARGESYELTPLGMVAGGSQSHAMNINDKNQVCGWDFTTFYDYRAWYWDGAIHLIPGSPGYAQAFGINEHSEVAGSMLDLFVYDIKTGNIDFILHPGAWGYAYAINNKGHIAGCYYTDFTTQILKPFFYENGNMHLLPSLGGPKVGVTNDVNELDHAVGWTKAADGEFHMFLYDGVMNDCGTPDGAQASGAYAINQSDIIAGYFEADGVRQAALMDYTTHTWTALGLLPDGISSEATGLNDLGQVVGRATLIGGEIHAFIWDSQHGMRDLNDLIPPDTGWLLSDVEDINNNGWIVGTGVNLGGLHPYLLTPVVVPCEGDVNGDNLVDPLDAGFVQSRFGCPVGSGDPDCDAADANGDAVVDPLDSGFVVSRFGPCP